jgi:hypothetical protein
VARCHSDGVTGMALSARAMTDLWHMDPEATTLVMTMAVSPPLGMTDQEVAPCGAGSWEPNPRLAAGSTWQTELSPVLMA